MKNFVTTLLAIATMFVVVACGNSGGGNNNPVPVCPLTHVYDPVSKNCVPATVNPGGLPNNGVVQYYDYNRYFVQQWGGYPQVYNGDMQIVNPAAYATFLREAMAVCDRNIWGKEYGLADCNNWVAGSFEVSWRMDGSMKPVVNFKAQPAQNFFNYAISFGIDGGGMAFNPLLLRDNNTFNLVNNSQGYEIRAKGSYWNGGGLRLIQIIVRNGKIGDNNATYELYYPHNNVSTKIATGKFKRY